MGGDPNHLLIRMILQVVRLWYVNRGRNIPLLRGLTKEKKKVDGRWIIDWFTKKLLVKYILQQIPKVMLRSTHHGDMNH